jgi:hypothetical protein
MRLESSKGHRATVWHAEECRRIERCVWVDDEIPAWGEATGKLVRDSAGNQDMEVVSFRAKKIVIGNGVVIINPVEDADDTDNRLTVRKVEQEAA